MELNISLASACDLQAVSKLYDDVTAYLESHINYCGWRRGAYPTQEDAQQALEQSCLYVAKSENEVVGSFILNQKFEPAYEAANWSLPSDYSNLFVIHTFTAHPAHSGKGIGRKMLEYIAELARSQGMSSIRLDTYEKNLPAIAVYESCGFRFVGKVDLGKGEWGLDLFNCYEKIL